MDATIDNQRREYISKYVKPFKVNGELYCVPIGEWFNHGIINKAHSLVVCFSTKHLVYPIYTYDKASLSEKLALIKKDNAVILERINLHALSVARRSVEEHVLDGLQSYLPNGWIKPETYSFTHGAIVTSADLLVGFVGWLTGQTAGVSTKNATVLADAVEHFCKINQLGECSGSYPTGVIFPNFDWIEQCSDASVNTKRAKVDAGVDLDVDTDTIHIRELSQPKEGYSLPEKNIKEPYRSSKGWREWKPEAVAFNGSMPAYDLDIDYDKAISDTERLRLINLAKELITIAKEAVNLSGEIEINLFLSNILEMERQLEDLSKEATK